MVEASSDLDCVLVQCDWGRMNPVLAERYGVRSYPTVLFCDPDGKPLEQLRTGEPEAVAAHMRRFVARMKGLDPAAAAGPENPAPPPFTEFSPQVLALARRAGKPLLVYFYDDSPASISTHQSLANPVLRPVAPRFLVAKKPYAKDDPICVKFKVERAPTILILDTSLERPEDAPLARIGGSRSARELLRELEAIRAGREAEPELPTGGPRPLLTPEDEKLSDDELDRQFIHAQIRIAEEWLNKNRKDKAKETLNDILKTYPKHRASQEARKLLEKLN